jgi:hypothetical protein
MKFAAKKTLETDVETKELSYEQRQITVGWVLLGDNKTDLRRFCDFITKNLMFAPKLIFKGRCRKVTRDFHFCIISHTDICLDATLLIILLFAVVSLVSIISLALLL